MTGATIIGSLLLLLLAPFFTMLPIFVSHLLLVWLSLRRQILAASCLYCVFLTQLRSFATKAPVPRLAW